MSKFKSNVLKMIKTNERASYALSVCTWLVITILTVTMLIYPAEVVERIDENNIVQQTKFDYRADMVASSLNPFGGIVEIEESVFTKTVKDIILGIDTSIRAEQPVKVVGTKKVILKLIAEDLWEKEYILEPETSFEMTGTINNLIEKDYRIDIKKLTDFIDRVEGEIDTRPSRYTYEIRPVINGTISYDGQHIPIENLGYTVLDYSQTQIKVFDESEYLKTTPIRDEIIIPNECNFMSIKIPIKLVKYGVMGIYLAISIALIYIFICHYRMNKAQLSMADRIDKRYRARLIDITEKIDAKDIEKMFLNSFRSLLRISDERDVSILRYKSDAVAIYYVIDESYMFSYRLEAKLEGKRDIQTNPIAERSVI